MSVESLNRRLEAVINNPNFNEQNSRVRYCSLLKEMLKHPAGFLLFHRLTIRQFDRLRHLIEPRLCHYSYKAIMSLSLTLRYLSCDDTIKLPLEVFDVPPNDLMDMVERVCEAIIAVLTPKVFFTLRNEELNQIAEQFEKMWNFPRCVGAYEFRQMICKVSRNEELRSLKVPIGFLCDAYCRFNAFYILDPLNVGKNDFCICLRNFNFVANTYMTRFRSFSDNQFYAGDYVTVGSEQSSLTRTHMRAYSTDMQYHKRVFNHRLERAYSVAENALGILFQRWRIFQSPIAIRPGTLQKIVGCTVVLHNWLIKKDMARGYLESTYAPVGFFVVRNAYNDLVPGNWGYYSESPGVQRFINSCRSKSRDGEMRREEIAESMVIPLETRGMLIQRNVTRMNQNKNGQTEPQDMSRRRETHELR